MAETRPQDIRHLRALRWRAKPAVAVAALAIATAAAPGGPPAPLVIQSDRMRIVRTRVLAPVVASVPIRTLRRWVRLVLALPATGTAPLSRSDCPALPTVGRPRDDPRRCAMAGAYA